eukprot:TRINITY_DN206_c0_g1_i14.p1 TRINITY_DN206_c0_g1~~TRINITY_DN206_c0_g1_i14.p1  ORF type:complete len:126 (-),score=19.15 TRINITY_DN206_c0_g1_i14:400-777(-)
MAFDPYATRSTLRNVLRAVANYDKEIGYTQGMNFVAASLLHGLARSIHLSPYDDPDEVLGTTAFWIMVYINFELNWRELYRDGMPKLLGLVHAFSVKLKRDLPRVYGLLKHYKVTRHLSKFDFSA